jgi:hypothetical protein
MPIWTIIAIMLLGGLLGGFINFLAQRRIAQVGNGTSAGDPVNIRWNSVECLALGLAASLLVPLFLHVASSGILEEILAENATPRGAVAKDLLVFFGFCLVAAITSRICIERHAQRPPRDL